MPRPPLHVMAAFCVLALGPSGCGEDDEPAQRAATATATAEPTEEPTQEPTPESTPAQPRADCRAGDWDIYVSGDSGVSCRQAKKIQARFLEGEKVPAGWECAVAACTKVEDDGTVRDFYWKPH